MKKILLALPLLLSVNPGSTAKAAAKEIGINLELPAIAAEPYHRPYVAIWLENSDRKAVATVALWWQKDTWLKDLRQWWRKVGRDGTEGIDAYTGATRKPGNYTLKWAPVDTKGKALPPGKYILNFEASREEGGRDHVKQEIELGKASEFKIPATKEIGAITINVPAL